MKMSEFMSFCTFGLQSCILPQKVLFGTLLGPPAPTTVKPNGILVVWGGSKLTFGGKLHFQPKSVFLHKINDFHAKSTF